MRYATWSLGLPPMSALILREGEPRSVELSQAVAEALSRAGGLQLVQTSNSGWWEVSSGTNVGVVSVGGLQIILQPKLPIQRLVFLMGYARQPAFWRDHSVSLDPAADVPEALAQAFVRLATRALDQGLLKGYQTVEESLSVLRGRIREADQVRRHWGRAIPLEVRYDDFTVDIAENQLLLAATERLLRIPTLHRGLRAGLQRLRLLLADVTAPVSGQTRPRWTVTRLNTRYVPALELAELILDGRSFEQRVGELTVSGYLFNMATIFEDFVTVALREALTPHEGRSSLQHHHHLDVADLVPIRPDFVWSKNGRPRIVADAKYKAEKPSGFPQADLYQMLAYCTTLGVPIGHLVYAKGNEDAREHVVRGSGVRLVAHALELDAPPAAVLSDIGALAQVMIDGVV